MGRDGSFVMEMFNNKAQEQQPEPFSYKYPRPLIYPYC